MASIDVLRKRDFRCMLLARVFGTMALQAQAVIVGWQIYSLTGSAFMLGLTGLFEAVPALLCALVAGHIVDTRRPLKVLQICVVALMANTTMLFLVAGGILDSTHRFTVPVIFAGVFFSGIARSFIIPCSFSLLPQIVTRAEIPAANAWLTNGFQMGVIVGPAVAGLIYGGYGETVAWSLPLTLILLQMVFVLALGRTHAHFRNSTVREAAMKSIVAGWAFIFRNRVLLAAMSLDMLAVLFGGVIAILPVYADQILHVGSEGLGLLRAAPAIGAGGMTLWYALYPPKRIKAGQLLWVMGAFGVTMIGFGLSKLFWLSMLFLIASGMVDSVGMVIRQTLTQWLTPPEMRGRVASVNSMFVISSNELGAFESGTAAHLLGLVPSVVMGGLVTLGMVALIGFMSPKLRHTVIDGEEKA